MEVSVTALKKPSLGVWTVALRAAEACGTTSRATTVTDSRRSANAGGCWVPVSVAWPPLEGGGDATGVSTASSTSVFCLVDARSALGGVRSPVLRVRSAWSSGVVASSISRRSIPFRRVSSRSGSASDSEGWVRSKGAFSVGRSQRISLHRFD